MKVAREVFAVHGYDSALIDDIAQAAGVSKPIVYEHFGAKEGLYAAIVDRELDDLVSRVSRSISSGTPRARFSGAVMAFMRYTQEEPAGFAVLARDAPTSLGRRGLTRVIDDLALRVSDVFRREFERAGYDPENAPIYAHALVGMVTQVGQWWATEGRRFPLEYLVSQVSALGWFGLRRLPKTRAPAAKRKKARAAVS
jgi:AcrR family transcriptional regulator